MLLRMQCFDRARVHPEMLLINVQTVIKLRIHIVAVANMYLSGLKVEARLHTNYCVSCIREKGEPLHEGNEWAAKRLNCLRRSGQLRRLAIHRLLRWG